MGILKVLPRPRFDYGRVLQKQRIDKMRRLIEFSL
jgi:hypothetical protein